MATTVFQVFGVTTPQAYRDLADAALRKSGRTTHVYLGPKPTVVLEPDRVYRFPCDCGNYPAVDPAWRMAVCLSCGLVVDDLTLPAEP